MGTCAVGPHSDFTTLSTPEQVAHEKRMAAIISASMDADKKKDANLLKLLLLGAGESGKTTIYRQLTHIYNSDPEDEKKKCIFAKATVHENCIQSMRALCEWSDKLAETKPELKTQCSNSPEILRAKENMARIKNHIDVTWEVAADIKLLWSDPGIQRTFDERHLFQIPDSVKFFFDKIEEIGVDTYTPSFDDLLRIRVRTAGIVQTEFTVENKQSPDRVSRFLLVDVGGQRNERKKWIHCFDKVTAVIFVVALSEFDQVLYEDGSTNRMKEAMDLFEEICNTRWFRDTSMILFLNKRDLLQEKLQRGARLSGTFPEYTGGQSYEAAVEFISDKFQSLNKFKDTKSVFVHDTCATDTGCVEFVFNSVKEIILTKRLQDFGF